MCFSHFPVPRCQHVFFSFFFSGRGGGAILERRKPVSWFTHFLQRFTVKWDEEVMRRIEKAVCLKKNDV